MLKSTSKVLLSQSQQSKKTKILNETQIFSKNNIRNENIDTNNTIKVDFSVMFKIKPKDNNQSYNQCTCGAILIADQQFKNQKIIQKDENNNYIWFCRFCKKNNTSKQVQFCQNNYKTILQKNLQRGFLPPILLFIVDLSGSMGETISVQFGSTQSKQKQKQKQSHLVAASKQIIDMIKNSIFYQKQLHKQARFKQKYQFGQQKQSKQNHYFSKITLFMAIIQHTLGKMREQFQLGQFRIGFVFFNEAIYIMKAGKQRTIPTFVDKRFNFKKDFPFQKTTVDFQNYQELFNAGKKYQRFFGDSKLKNCDMSKLITQNLDTQGQTALGPALSIALGIASVHDVGSRIILVSDAMPNIGILSPQTSLHNQKVYHDIGKFLQLRKVTISILNWITQNGNDYKQKLKSQFGQFLSSNKQQIKQISLDFSLRQGHIQVLNTARKTLQNLMKGGSLGQVISTQIFISNAKIQATKLKYDDTNFRLIRFLGLHKKSWIQLKLKKISQQDLLFPVYTQIVVNYQDVLTKQKYLFMSYTKHKIISAQNDKQVYQYLDNSSSTHNLNQLMDLQKIFNFDRKNIMLESVASRSYCMASISLEKKEQVWNPYIMSNNSLNSLAELENRINQNDDQDYTYL